MKRKILPVFLLILVLPLLTLAVLQIQTYLSRASSLPADIHINVNQTHGPVTRPWAAYSQGGEETDHVFTNIIPQLRSLSPRYIRIDHIYDFYDVVKKTDSGMVYDFSKLDKTVDEITATGALPFFSLSYMPKVFTSDQSVISVPTDWNLWKELVSKTIEHYSGRTNKNLIGVYYEVWNEPELPQFGKYSIKGTDKDYKLLYYYASIGAEQIKDTNVFSLGGPAVGSYYSEWVTDFLNYVQSNSLRLDFYSWHRYNKSASKIKDDAQAIRRLLQKFPAFSSLPLILTEWGYDSENVAANNSQLASAFTIASIAEFESDITLAFHFEVKDGPPPHGGTWGLFTHEQGSPPTAPKMSYYPFKALEELKGLKLDIKGNGTYVKALGAKSADVIKLVISNYDPYGKNAENVPLHFKNIANGTYEVTTEYVFEKAALKTNTVILKNTFDKNIPLLPSQIVVITLTKNGEIAQYVSGKDKVANQKDQAFSLLSGSLSYSRPDFNLTKSGILSFDINPSHSLPDSFFIFDIPYSTQSGKINHLYLSKQKINGNGAIKFGVSTGSLDDYFVLVPSSAFKLGNWNHIETSWSPSGLSLEINGSASKSPTMNLKFDNGSLLRFYELDAALDNLEIKTSSPAPLIRKFDGNTSR